MVFKLCINLLQQCASPPGNCGAFAHVVSPGGGAFTILLRPRRLGNSIPRGNPRAFDTRVFERQISLTGHAIFWQTVKNKIKRNIQYNQNQLARTLVLEVFKAVVLKYWTVDCVIHWLIKIRRSVGRRRYQGRGICPLSLSPPQGI